jgi:hypothetical protein
MQGDRSGSETEELFYKDLKECIRRRRNATNVSSLVVEKRESKPAQDFS